MKCILLALSLLGAPDEIDYQTVKNSEVYEFRINYWFNMHHFLKHEAFLQVDLDSTIVTETLSNASRKELELALAYYKDQFIKKDLRTDEYMSAFKVWITEVGESPETVPIQFVKHFNVLKSFSDTYEKYFWKTHEASCHAALDKYLPLIKKTENAYWEQVRDATKAFILDDTVKVDVVYYGKANKWNTRSKPYTSLFPTRVVMDSYQFDEIEGEWLELLFHESAHALILSRTGYVAGTIIDVAKHMDVKIPRQLSHAYLFYITGYFAQKLLEQEGISYPTMYMQNKRVFSRYYQSLTKLDKYLTGDEYLAETTMSILTDLTK